MTKIRVVQRQNRPARPFLLRITNNGIVRIDSHSRVIARDNVRAYFGRFGRVVPKDSPDSRCKMGR